MRRWAFCFIFLLMSFVFGTVQMAWSCSSCADSGSDIYAQIHLNIEKEHLAELDVRWRFSGEFTRNLLKEYDVNKNGRLDVKEERAMREHFEGINPSEFLGELSFNGQAGQTINPHNLRFHWDEKQASLSFSIPLGRSIDRELRLAIRFLDPKGNFKFYFHGESVLWNPSTSYRISSNATLFPETLEVTILS
jgi:ABC-type uncharacterized transport system substrate-binding protein